jgi:tryptophan 2,3-dioxygenase
MTNTGGEDPSRGPIKRPLYYGEYLQLGRLLSCQEPVSAMRGEPVHDEYLFIVVHQTYELWFQQVLRELDAVLAVFGGPTVREKDLGRVVSHLIRVSEIFQLLIQQIDVLETMTPLDFLDFRDSLVPASGFQSVQFRLIENKLGLSTAARLKVDGAPYTARLSEEDRRRLEESEREPTLLGLLDAWLARTPFLHLGEYDFWREYRRAVEEMLARDRKLIIENPSLGAEERAAQVRMFERLSAHFDALFDLRKHEAMIASGERRLSHNAFLAALLINLYRDEPILHLPFRLLTHLMDVDETLTTWRYRHALMVSRMIGGRIGTGGTSGGDYLRETAEKHRVFTDLFNLSTFLIPRSALPKLPPEVERKMSFQYSG